MEEAPIQLEVTDVIDLHTFAPRDIPAVVEAYLEEARAKGFETVRIIHGRGKGVQRARVQSVLRANAVRGIVSRCADGSRRLGRDHRLVIWKTEQRRGDLT